MRLKSSVQEIKGIGEKTAKLFAKTGVYTVGDILLHFPRTYHQYPGVQSPQETLAEEESAVTGILKTPPLVRRGRRMDITVATAFCGDMSVELVWYRMPYLKSQLKAYTPYIFYGKLLTEGKRCRMEQCSVYEPAQYQRLTMSLQPIYPLTKGLTNQAVRKAVRQALTDAEFPKDFCRKRFAGESSFSVRRTPMRACIFRRIWISWSKRGNVWFIRSFFTLFCVPACRRVIRQRLRITGIFRSRMFVELWNRWKNVCHINSQRGRRRLWNRLGAT